MTAKQKMLVVTFFYNPAVTNLEILTTGPTPVTDERLYAGIEKCLEKGGMVRISHEETDLVNLACQRRDHPPTHEWVGLAYVAVQPTTSEIRIVTGEMDV